MASDLRGYTEQEVLNKVLNTSSDSIKVDIVSGSEYAEDAEHSSGDTGTFVLGVRNDTLATLGGADGDYSPLQVNASGALYVEVASASADDSIYVDDADWTDSTSKHTLVGGLYQSSPQTITDGDVGPLQVNSNGNLIIDVVNGGVLEGLVDGIETLLGTIDSDTDAIKTAVQVLDDWDDSNYANVNMNFAGSDAQAGEGTISATTQRVTIATDDDGVAHLATIAGDTTSIQTAVELIDDTVAVLGTATYSETSTKGSVVGVVRNDTLAPLADTDNEVAPLQVNAAGALYTSDASGEAGSILVTGTGTVTTTVTANTAFVAIQFITDTVFDSTNATGLVSVTDQLYPSSEFTSTSIDADAGAVTDSVTFPQGMTIFGRWSGFKLASGSVIAYIGYV